MKKLIAISIALLASTVALSGCSKSVAEKVSPKEFAQVIADPAVVVVDVRTPAEFAQGHLPNAVNIDFESGNFEDGIRSLDKSKTYAVYCRSGNRSGQAVKVMAELGITNLFDMDGGIVDWQAAGGQIVTE